MSDLVSRSLRTMLAESLDVDPERLAHLDRLGPDRLRLLKERVSDKLFDEHAPVFARVSRLAPLVPAIVAAKLAVKVVDPIVGGRAAGSIGVDHPDKARGVLSHLPPAYMADCAAYLDPRAITVLAPLLDPGPLVPAANELLRRKAYITAARFVDFATEEMIHAFEAGITDNEGLLHTASLAASTERLTEIIGQLPDERVDQIVLASTSSPEATLAGLSLLGRLDPGLSGRLGDTFFTTITDDQLTDVLTVASERGATAELKVVHAHLGATAKTRLSAHPLWKQVKKM